MAEEKKLNKSGNRRGMGGEGVAVMQRMNRERSRKEAMENGKKGGIISGKVRKEAKSLREAINMIMSMKVIPSVEKTVTSLSPELEECRINYQTALGARLLNQALNGDLKAAELLTKLSGDHIEKHELTGANGMPLIEKKLSQEEADNILSKLEEKFGANK